MPLLFVLQDYLLLSHPGSGLLFLLATPLTSFTFSNVHVHSGCNNIISDSTWRILTVFFFRQVVCWKICSAGMWPTKRGEGANPSHLLCISPLIPQQPLNLIFQCFSLRALCSAFSCGTCRGTQLIVKTLYLWSCFLSLYLLFIFSSNYCWVSGSHKAEVSLHHSKVPDKRGGRADSFKVVCLCNKNEAGINYTLVQQVQTYLGVE